MKLKQHQIIALEKGKESQVKKLIGERLKRWNDNYIHGHHVFFKPFADEETMRENPALRPPREEDKPVNVIISDNITYLSEIMANWMDIVLTKDQTNCNGTAVAPLVISGVDYGTFSVITLLDLEKMLKKVHEVIASIPTLNINKNWTWNEERALWQASDDETYTTAKVKKVITLHPGNDKHPAQVQLVPEDQKIATKHKTHFSSALTSREKAEMMQRLELVFDAVKTSREAANSVEVEEIKISEKLLGFIFQG